MTRRSPLIIEGEVLTGVGAAGRRPAPAAYARFDLRRYGLAAGVAALMLALAAMVLLAPDVSALPGIALLEGGH